MAYRHLAKERYAGAEECEIVEVEVVAGIDSETGFPCSQSSFYKGATAASGSVG